MLSVLGTRPEAAGLPTATARAGRQGRAGAELISRPFYAAAMHISRRHVEPLEGSACGAERGGQANGTGRGAAAGVPP